MAKIHEEPDTADYYDSAEQERGSADLAGIFGGLLGCARHPVVLRYGLLRPTTGSAVLRAPRGAIKDGASGDRCPSRTDPATRPHVPAVR